jgi:hypothetical protein
MRLQNTCCVITCLTQNGCSLRYFKLSFHKLVFFLLCTIHLWGPPQVSKSDPTFAKASVGKQLRWPSLSGTLCEPYANSALVVGGKPRGVYRQLSLVY